MTQPDYEAVNHPAHYNQHPAGIECIDVIEPMQFNIGNAIKYLWRAGLKPGTDTLQDLRKAEWYIKREIERLRSASDPKTGDERMTELEQKYLGKTVQMTGEVVDVVEPNSDSEVIGVKVGKTVEYVMPQSVEVVEWKQAEGISYIWYAQETNIKCPCGEEVFMDSDPAVCDGCGREYRVCHYVVVKMGSEEK